jgi:hypothetical protein
MAKWIEADKSVRFTAEVEWMDAARLFVHRVSAAKAGGRL